MHKTMQELPIKIQSIVYNKNLGELKILLLKRSPEDGGFWQTVTGTLEINESIIDSRARELVEEAGINNAKFSDEIYRFSWEKKGYTVVEIVYAAETYNQDVVLSHEHTDYIWLSIDDAIEKVEKQNTKNSLIEFSKKIE